MTSWVPFRVDQNVLRAQLSPEKVSIVFWAIAMKTNSVALQEVPNILQLTNVLLHAPRKSSYVHF